MGAYWRDHLWPNERCSLAWSAGAFSASVGAGLLSCNTLAKADFFTGKLYLRSFEGGSVCVCSCVCVCVCVLQGLGSQQAAAHFLLNCSLRLNRCSRYIRSCAGTQKHTASARTRAHTHTSAAAQRACGPSCRVLAHTQLPPTSQVTEEQDARTSPQPVKLHVCVRQGYTTKLCLKIC